MPSHFSSLGFDVETEEAFIELAQMVADDTEEFVVSDGRYLRWHCPSGAELWLQVDSDDNFIGMNPHYDGPTSLPVGLTARVARDTDTEFDGAFYAWASPGEGAEDGLYPFVFDCPDYQLQQSLVLPARRDLQVAAFAHEIDVFPDKDAYYASQSEDGPKFGDQFFIPAGLFSPDGDSTESPQALALFAGYVNDAAERTNSLTGLRFIAMEVETYGGQYSIVADPILVTSPLPRGAIVSGSFWLSGRIR